MHSYMVPSCYLCYILYTVLTFVHSLQKEVNDKIAEVVFKESNDNNKKVFCLSKSHLVYLNPFSSDYSSWLNDHVRMLITVSYIDIQL